MCLGSRHQCLLYVTVVYSVSSLLNPTSHPLDCVVAGEMWFLNMQSLKAAQNSPIAWTDVGPTPYGPSYNQPVMALANNHIHFIDVPNVPSGSIDIFVIHCELNYGLGSYEIHSRCACNKTPTFSHNHSSTLCQVEPYRPPMVKPRRFSSRLRFVGSSTLKK